MVGGSRAALGGEMRGYFEEGYGADGYGCGVEDGAAELVEGHVGSVASVDCRKR